MSATEQGRDQRSIAAIGMVNVDCADAQASAAFYGAVLGWDVVHSEADYAMISGDGTSIGFGRTEGYEPPPWPGPELGTVKRFHLDLYVNDLDTGEAGCVQLGATRPAFQPGGERWRVLIDPGGHPFCIALRT